MSTAIDITMDASGALLDAVAASNMTVDRCGGRLEEAVERAVSDFKTEQMGGSELADARQPDGIVRPLGVIV